jgi:hypothetical protein
LITEERLDVGKPQPTEFANPAHLAEGEGGSIGDGWCAVDRPMRGAVGNDY